MTTKTAQLKGYFRTEFVGSCVCPWHPRACQGSECMAWQIHPRISTYGRCLLLAARAAEPAVVEARGKAARGDAS